MSTKNFAIDKKVGLFAIHDTGAPDGRNDYKTLVILHGLAWSRGERHIPSTLADYLSALNYLRNDTRNIRPSLTNGTTVQCPYHPRQS